MRKGIIGKCTSRHLFPYGGLVLYIISTLRVWHEKTHTNFIFIQSEVIVTYSHAFFRAYFFVLGNFFIGLISCKALLSHCERALCKFQYLLIISLSGVHHPERAISLFSCNGVFTSTVIFRCAFPAKTTVSRSLLCLFRRLLFRSPFRR